MSFTAASPLVLIGAGGHAKVLHALIEAAGLNLVGVCDPRLAEAGVTSWRGVPVLGGDEALSRLSPAEVRLVNGVGQLVGKHLREELFKRMRAAGFGFPALVHPMAWIAPGVRLDEGCQVMAGAILQPDCQVGENSVINTRASIDHDCRIGNHVHVAPGVTLCGGVQVEDGAFVGAGAVVLPGLRIGSSSVVGAGTTLTRGLEAALVWRGHSRSTAGN